MKINKICINKNHISDLDFNYNYAFFLFRTPVTFQIDGEKITFKSTSAGIFSVNNIPEFFSANKTPIKFDYVSFQTTTIDKQYMDSMNLPINIPVPIFDDLIISNTLNSMKSEFSQKGKYYIEFMELSMRIIFISVCEMSVYEKKLSDIPHYNRLKAIRKAIIAEPMKQWSVDDICYNLNISRTYFHRLYREAFGIMCIQDVIRNRINYACNLLKDTDLSVNEIAEKSGYDSDSYFMKQFRQCKNCTPSEYRRKKQDK